jgi:hypothetical protein
LLQRRFFPCLSACWEILLYEANSLLWLESRDCFWYEPRRPNNCLLVRRSWCRRRAADRMMRRSLAYHHLLRPQKGRNADPESILTRRFFPRIQARGCRPGEGVFGAFQEAFGTEVSYRGSRAKPKKFFKKDFCFYTFSTFLQI